MGNIENLTGMGKGRQLGSKNKRTKERQEAFKEYIEKNRFHYRFLEIMLDRLQNEPEMIKFADLIKGFEVVRPFVVYTLKEEAEQERFDTLVEKVDAETLKEQISSIVGR